jgi:hypothetical protein
MLLDQTCERCRRDDAETLVDIASTPMRRVTRDDPSPNVDVSTAVFVCEECAEDFGARIRPVSPAEFITGGDRTIG